MFTNGGEGDDGYTGNEEWDQAAWNFESKGGYGPDFFYDDDEDEADDRARLSRRIFTEFLAVASPKEREVLKAALARMRRGEELNWEAIGRELGKSSGAVKTQVQRAMAKFARHIGFTEDK